MTGQHLISEDETRRIAEDFLAAAPWFGDVTWGKTGAGNGGRWAAPAWYPEDEERNLGEDGRWSWSVKVVDPTGDEQDLNHAKVLEGVRGLIFGEVQEAPADMLPVSKLKQWFTEPASKRQKLILDAALSSRICQQALYGRKVFLAGDETSWSDKKLDWFEDQRPSTENGS